MNTNDVIVARVYMTEGEHRLNGFLQLLHDELKVKGVTVFRGITGFGKSGKMHSSNLLDVSMDLPLIVEFFDEPERMVEVLEKIEGDFDPGHILSWSAKVNL